MKKKVSEAVEYYRLLRQQMLHEKRIIDTLVDSKQRYTKGILCEEIIRRHLRKLLPSNLRVVQGFIDFNGVKSPQCDIIIFDSSNYSPLLEVNDLVLLPKEAVNAIIEVKSKLTRTETKRTLDNFKLIDDLCGNIKSIRKYLVGFTSANLKSFLEYHQLNPFPEYLDNIVILDKGFIRNENNKIAVFRTEDSFFVLLMILYDHYYFSTGLTGPKKNPYSEYIKNISGELMT